MFEFSISAIVDGVIHLTAFLITCVAMHVFLKIVARGKFESGFVRMVTTVGAFVLAHTYLSGVDWATDLTVLASVLLCVSLLLMFALLKTPILAGLLGASTLVAIGLGMNHLACMAFEKVGPEGPTFKEYLGLAQSAVEENRSSEGLKSTEVGVRDIVRGGLDALASLTAEEEVEAMQEDFSRGMDLFAERKAWMDSLTPAEKQAYRDEMSAFLAEQGIASDRYSLAAIKDVNPTNLAALATLFNDLQSDETESDAQIRSIPESIAAIASNLGGLELSAEDVESLQGFAELFGRDEFDEAVAQARAEIAELEGDSEFLGTVLAAMLQAESDLPMDQFFGSREGADLFDEKELMLVETKGPEEVLVLDEEPAAVVLEIEEIPPEASQKEEPYISITTSLGVVKVPNDEAVMEDWIAAAQRLEMKGYVSLGDEIVILRTDGTMLRKGEECQVEYTGYTYRFHIESILKGRVAIRSDVREELLAP